MSENQPVDQPAEEKQKPAGFSFSLLSLLTLLAIAGVWTAFLNARGKNGELNKRMESLLSVSSQLVVRDESKLASSAWPTIDSKYSTWDVYVPAGQEYELRLGVGLVDASSIPVQFDAVPLDAGRHRITAFIEDSFSKDYRIDVYVDGELAIERPIEKSWMPNGWSSGSSMSWPTGVEGEPETSLQLKATSYSPRYVFESPGYFNGYRDEWVSSPGFRLWIDQADREHKPASPFMGFDGYSAYLGAGLRDGLRFSKDYKSLYRWHLRCPALEESDSLLTITAEFLVDGEVVLDKTFRGFEAWTLSDLSHDEGSNIATARLEAAVGDEPAIAPVVELMWDATRPNDIAFRLPLIEANSRITSWRLQIGDGLRHFWRQANVGGEYIDLTKSSEISEAFPLQSKVGEKYEVSWSTNETAPLQFLPSQKGWPKSLGYRVYEGLPVKFEVEVPAGLSAFVKLDLREALSDSKDEKVPGGPVIENLILEMEGSLEEPIWLSAELLSGSSPKSDGP